jgi:hypothetical protein
MAIGALGGCGREFIVVSYCVEEPKIVSRITKDSWQRATSLLFVGEESQIVSRIDKDQIQRAAVDALSDYVRVLVTAPGQDRSGFTEIEIRAKGQQMMSRLK